MPDFEATSLIDGVEPAHSFQTRRFDLLAGFSGLRRQLTPAWFRPGKISAGTRTYRHAGVRQSTRDCPGPVPETIYREFLATPARSVAPPCPGMTVECLPRRIRYLARSQRTRYPPARDPAGIDDHRQLAPDLVRPCRVGFPDSGACAAPVPVRPSRTPESCSACRSLCVPFRLRGQSWPQTKRSSSCGRSRVRLCFSFVPARAAEFHNEKGHAVWKKYGDKP